MACPIRPARADDVETLAALHLASWRAACAGILPAAVLAGVSLERRTRDWTRWLAAPGTRTFVAARDGPLAGFVTLGAMRANGRPSRTLAELRMLYVDPGTWRGGVGRALVEQAVNDARGRGFEQLILWVFRENRRARAFYAALGFEPDRTRQVTHGGHAVDERRYVRAVGSD